MNIWLLKCRKYLPDQREGWSWDQYFGRESDEYAVDDTWGEPEWIRSRQSKKFIREKVKKHDLVVCYQSEGRRICGFTRMAGDGRDNPQDSGDFNMLFIAAAKKGLCMEPELTVDQLRSTGCDPVWLQKGQGTVFPLSLNEFKGIVRAVRVCCSGMERDLERWLQRVGFVEGANTSPEAGKQKLKLPKGGAGFSSNTQRNAKVERSAVRLVMRSLKGMGWNVKDVQKDCCGYDLLCTKGSRKQMDVEVKGVSGSLANFPITFGEVRKAETNPNFAIHIVTEALTRNPKTMKLTGRGFLSDFDLKPIQYMANRKS